MEGDHWPHGSCDGAGRDLARLRNRASGFFESLSVAELVRDSHRHLWISDWIRIADDYRTFAETARKDGSVPIAREAWLCALTALEVVRSLSCPGDLDTADLADKVDYGLRAFEEDAGPAVERVEIDCLDEEAVTGLFFPAGRQGPAAPTVICVSDENTTLESMMSRLLPVALGRKVSLLFVDAGSSSVRRPFTPGHALQSCLDYLETRPDVDPRRIAVYGEGGGAAHASRLALANRRIVAAVSDGGFLAPVMRRTSLRWMTGIDPAADGGTSTDTSPSRRLACPLLVVVGSRSMIWEQDAVALQAAYRQAGADCSVVVPHRIPHPLGEVENFIAVDDFIFKWLGCKLGANRRLEAVTYL